MAIEYHCDCCKFSSMRRDEFQNDNLSNDLARLFPATLEYGATLLCMPCWSSLALAIEQVFKDHVGEPCPDGKDK